MDGKEEGYTLFGAFPSVVVLPRCVSTICMQKFRSIMFLLHTISMRHYSSVVGNSIFLLNDLFDFLLRETIVEASNSALSWSWEIVRIFGEYMNT